MFVEKLLHNDFVFVFFSTGSGPDLVAIAALKCPSSGLMLFVIGVCATEHLCC